jgi:hypothetical protein
VGWVLTIGLFFENKKNLLDSYLKLFHAKYLSLSSYGFLSFYQGVWVMLHFFIILSKDHTFSTIILFTTAGVKFYVAAVKSWPVLQFSVVIFFLVFKDHWFQHKCWKLRTAQACTKECGCEGCCTLSLSLMHRLIQPESAIFK